MRTYELVVEELPGLIERKLSRRGLSKILSVVECASQLKPAIEEAPDELRVAMRVAMREALWAPLRGAVVHSAPSQRAAWDDFQDCRERLARSIREWFETHDPAQSTARQPLFDELLSLLDPVVVYALQACEATAQSLYGSAGDDVHERHTGGPG